jgi:hypothetical protein
LGDALEHAGEVVSGESPVERLGDGVVAVLEGGETVGDLVEIVKVVGGDDFALDDREDDLDLVEPGCVLGRWMSRRLGQAPSRRSTDAWPRWLLPLSTTQNTRRAEA